MLGHFYNFNTFDARIEVSQSATPQGKYLEVAIIYFADNHGMIKIHTTCFLILPMRFYLCVLNSQSCTPSNQFHSYDYTERLRYKIGHVCAMKASLLLESRQKAFSY